MCIYTHFESMADELLCFAPELCAFAAPLGCVVGMRVHACCRQSFVGSSNFDRGPCHDPPCPMAPRLSIRYKGPVIWQERNPKYPGSAARARYDRYKSSSTFADAIAAGMHTRDIAWDVKHEYVKSNRPLFESELASPGSMFRGDQPWDLLQGEDGRQPLASSDGGSSPH
jgi:hypothetical protein